MEKKRNMPVGIQNFEEIVTVNNYVYVDKTDYVHKLATEGKYYFLGRPRRFGKSLFLSTLKAYFLGRRDLFQGLRLAELEKDWVKYPVLHLDLNAGKYTNIEALQCNLDNYLKDFEHQWSNGTDEGTLAVRFYNVIKWAHEKSGKKVVILIDEYDKPLISTLENQDLHEEMRAELKGFYGVLKAADEHIRFAFLTGITKFSQVSVFSDLNMLWDISMEKEYACICGITEAELEANFKPAIEAMAEEQCKTYGEMLAGLRRQYDGYRFTKDGKNVYNPFSLVRSLAAKDLEFYWFNSGTPTFLINEMKREKFDLGRLGEGIYMSNTAIERYHLGADPVPLLYQSGYFTIDSYDESGRRYKLRFPNEEVRLGFLECLLEEYIAPGNKTEFDPNKLYEALENGNIERVIKHLRAFFANISFRFFRKDDRERAFQGFVYVLFMALGSRVYAELESCEGRSDLVVKLDKIIYAFEFKFVASSVKKPDKQAEQLKFDALASEALRQIDTKGYMVQFSTDARHLVKVGVVFSGTKRNIVAWLSG